MYFRDPKKELPEENQIILVKFKGKSNDNYYVCTYIKNVCDQLYFVEACFENCSWFNVEDVLGWMPISELDSIEIK